MYWLAETDLENDILPQENEEGGVVGVTVG